MNNTNQNQDNLNAVEELADEQLDNVSGGITPIPIPGALDLNTGLINLSRTNLEYAIGTITRTY